MAYDALKNILSGATTGLVAKASTASSALATITAGSDVLTTNFSGVKATVDQLSSMATELSSGPYTVWNDTVATSSLSGMSAGQLYFNTSTHMLYVYSNGAWVALVDADTVGGKRLAYQTRTSNFSSSGTSFGSALFSNATFTADGTSSYMVEVYFPRVDTPTQSSQNITYVALSSVLSGTVTEVGQLGQAYSNAGVGPLGSTQFFARTFITPAAGTCTLNVHAWGSGGSFNIVCGAATGAASSNDSMPGYIAVYNTF